MLTNKYIIDNAKTLNLPIEIFESNISNEEIETLKNEEFIVKEIEDVLGIDASMAIPVSAKTGVGIYDVLEAIVEYIPAPVGEEDKPFQNEEKVVEVNMKENYFSIKCHP